VGARLKLSHFALSLRWLCVSSIALGMQASGTTCWLANQKTLFVSVAAFVLTLTLCILCAFYGKRNFNGSWSSVALFFLRVIRSAFAACLCLMLISKDEVEAVCALFRLSFCTAIHMHTTPYARAFEGALGEPMLRHWNNNAQALETMLRHWNNSAQALEQQRFNVGTTMLRRWDNNAQALEQQCPGMGTTTLRHWNNNA